MNSLAESYRVANARKKWSRLLHNCPGAWCGCAPRKSMFSDEVAGYITVDPKSLLAALEYLDLNGVRVFKTHLSDWSFPGGLVLVHGPLDDVDPNSGASS